VPARSLQRPDRGADCDDGKCCPGRPARPCRHLRFPIALTAACRFSKAQSHAPETDFVAVVQPMRKNLFVVDENAVGRQQIDHAPGAIGLNQAGMLGRHARFVDAEITYVGSTDRQPIAGQAVDLAGFLTVRVAGQKQQAGQIALVLGRIVVVEDIGDLIPGKYLSPLGAGPF